MAAFLRKAKRRAFARRWQREARAQAAPIGLDYTANPVDLDLQAECEIDPTPTPRPVTVDLSSYAEPPITRTALGRFAPHGHAPRRRRMVVALAAMISLIVSVLVLRGAPRASASALVKKSLELEPIAAAAALVAEMPSPTLPIVMPTPSGPRADAKLDRSMYGHIRDGVLFVPKTFSSEDGAYDLYLHFHGNTRVVLESAEHAGLNALVAVVNAGVNSQPYLDEFAEPGSFEALLENIERAATERGLARPRLRRLALGSWSGGYGAISRVLETGRAGLAKLDSILVLDGIHCGFLEENPKALNVRIISPFVDVTKRAAEGKILFSITHSEIDPIGYAGSYLTAGYLLDLVNGKRGAPGPAPEHLKLRAGEGAVAKKLEKKMEPVSDSIVGSFHVRGYRRNTPEHHMAHLLQMGATVMPELAERWR